MTLRIQYWAEGVTPSADVDTAGTGITILDVDVLECFPRENWTTYSAKTLLDGTRRSWRRKYLTVQIVFGPRALADPTIRATVVSALSAPYFRIKDARHVSLGTANTIIFTPNGDTALERADKSLITERATLELISQAVQ